MIRRSLTTPARFLRTGPRPTQEPPDPWQALRTAVGARWMPARRVFPTRRSSLRDLQPGERLLLLLQYAGIGDHLVASMLFPMLRAQYPEIRVSYACQSRVHPLFEGTGVDLVTHDGPCDPAWLEQYDLIEDINIPCHVWERFFVARGGPEGHGLRWRNRLEMFAGWIGLPVRTPRSDVAITDAEQAEARAILQRSGVTGQPVCLLAPCSLDAAKSYPWYGELAQALQADGWAVRLLHSATLPGPVPTLAGLSLRMMGAVCRVADVIVSVDSGAFHWGGILQRPTVGIFASNNGAAYCRYYPTAVPVQVCASGCIHNIRWGKDLTSCPHIRHEALPPVPEGLRSHCYPRGSVAQILATVRRVAGQPGRA